MTPGLCVRPGCGRIRCGGDENVFEGLGRNHGLPEESHGSLAYAKLYRDGNLQQLRFYNAEKRLLFEIGYHRERKLTGHYREVYHMHEYGSDMQRGDARFLTEDEIKKFERYFTVKGRTR